MPFDSGRAVGRDGLGDGLDDGLLRGESGAGLFRDLRAVHPDGELAAAAGFEIGIEVERFLDERRHTGGARQVVSDLAVANADAAHQLVLYLDARAD